MKYHSPLHIGSGLVLVFLVGLTGCARAPSETPKPAPIQITVSQPVERNVTDYADFTGRISAVDSVEVRARVGGYLNRVSFQEGQLVKKGDVLFEIDPRPYQAQVDRSASQVIANQASVRKAKADNVRAKKIAATSRGAITAQELDLNQATEDEAIATLATSEAILRSDQLNLSFTKVTAPISGRISRYYVTVGNLVVQDQTLLTTLVSVNPMYAYFDMDEHTVLRVGQLIRDGKAESAREVAMPITLSLANEDGFRHQGTINFVDNQINPRTGTLRLRGVFPNEHEVLTPGLFVRVRVPIGQAHRALLVTERAIDNDQGQKILYVVNDQNEVASRPIVVGALHDGLREISHGLKSGERVVVNGLQQVGPGVSVEPKLVAMATPKVRNHNGTVRVANALPDAGTRTLTAD